MFGNLTGFHLLIVVGVVVLLFGAAKLPLLAKNLGQSAKILKTELKSMQSDDDEPVRVPTDAPAATTRSVAVAAEPQRAERL